MRSAGSESKSCHREARAAALRQCPAASSKLHSRKCWPRCSMAPGRRMIKKLFRLSARSEHVTPKDSAAEAVPFWFFWRLGLASVHLNSWTITGHWSQFRPYLVECPARCIQESRRKTRFPSSCCASSLRSKWSWGSLCLSLRSGLIWHPTPALLLVHLFW